jgi:hypothetical protein
MHGAWFIAEIETGASGKPICTSSRHSYALKTYLNSRQKLGVLVVD